MLPGGIPNGSPARAIPHNQAQHFLDSGVELIIDEDVIRQLHTDRLFFFGLTETLMHLVVGVAAAGATTSEVLSRKKLLLSALSLLIWKTRSPVWPL
jgi:hypothetical protein